ncbi:MAG: hypothetical protein L0Z49_14150 [Actinobacteria bacterium]|nr:hypothetical protein [Actinomycetota bacterium]
MVENVKQLAEGPHMIRVNSNSQSITTGTWTPVNYDTLVESSTGANAITYSTTDDEFILPQTGRYWVTANAQWGLSTSSTGGTARNLVIATSTAAGPGNPVARDQVQPPATTSIGVTNDVSGDVVITAIATQKIVIKAHQDSGDNLSLIADTTAFVNRVSIRWVGKA